MMNLDLREIPAVYMNLEQHTEKNENMQKILKECGFKTIIRVEGVPRPDRPVAGCSSARDGSSDSRPICFIRWHSHRTLRLSGRGLA